MNSKPSDTSSIIALAIICALSLICVYNDWTILAGAISLVQIILGLKLLRQKLKDGTFWGD